MGKMYESKRGMYKSIKSFERWEEERSGNRKDYRKVGDGRRGLGIGEPQASSLFGCKMETTKMRTQSWSPACMWTMREHVGTSRRQC